MRVVVVGLAVCLLVCCACVSASRNDQTDAAAMMLDEDAQGAAASALAEQEPVAVPAPTAAYANGVLNSNETDVESMISGDVPDSAEGGSPSTEALGSGAPLQAQVSIAAARDSGKSSGSSRKHSSSSKGGKKSSHVPVDSEDDFVSDGSGSKADGSAGSKKSHKRLPSCPLWPSSATDQGTLSTQRPAALSIFSELTVDEYNAVLNYLYSKKKLGLVDLVSVDPDRTVLVANYIHSIHMEMPPKHEVLQYLDNYGPKPERRARAVLILGYAHPPVVREVVVTLHDEGDSITVSDLKRVNIMSSKLHSIPYNQRPQSVLDENGVISAVEDAAETLNKVFKKAFNGFTYGEGCGEEGCIDFEITYTQTFPNEDVPRGSYITFNWEAETQEGNYLHRLPVQALVAASGDRLEEWSIIRIWFAGKYFDTAEELLHAWHHDVKGLRSNFHWEFPEGDDALFATFQKRPGHKRGADQPVGPIPWEPYGKRFTITHGNKVDWLGFSLHVGYLPHYGARFWDVRFKGERLAYEISLQEALAVYGAADLTQTNTVFLDSAFGMGYNLRELAQGLDCPITAAYMDADIFYGGMSGPTTYKNAICVFEHNPSMPILRHYSSAYKYYGGVPGAQLVVRMISTVYNYDYIQDLVLGVDGTIDVRVTTSGYIQSTTPRGFYPQHFGFPLAQNVTGTVHTHVLAWKVDLDIAGTHNSLKMLDFKSAKADNGLGGEIYINKYDAHIIEKEDDSGFICKLSEPKMPIIVNEHKRNKWGSPRGYKIQLNRPLPNLEPKDYPRSAGLGFWKWNFVATKRNEHESHSSSYYTQSDLTNPPTSLPHYVNGESIRREDLVVWVNSGLYHVPMAEDAPVTPASGHNQLGFSLIPYNWADENAAADMADMFTVSAEEVNSTKPIVQKILHKCKPTYETVHFATTGFEGITNTDEEVSDLGTEHAAASTASDQAHGKVTSVGNGGVSDRDIPAASVASAARPAQTRVRTCRQSKRWGAC